MLFQNSSKKNYNKNLFKDKDYDKDFNNNNNNNSKNSNDSRKSYDTLKIEARKNKDIFSREDTNSSEIIHIKSFNNISVINNHNNIKPLDRNERNNDERDNNNNNNNNNLGSNLFNPILLESFSEEFKNSSNIITNSLDIKTLVNYKNKINSNNNNINSLRLNGKLFI
jgi:hypothetical protein